MASQLPRFWCFFATGSWEKDTKNKAAVTSLRSFLFCDDFSTFLSFLVSPARTYFKISSLEIDIFDWEIMVKSGIDFFLLWNSNSTFIVAAARYNKTAQKGRIGQEG